MFIPKPAFTHAPDDPVFWAAVRAQYEPGAQENIINLENAFFSIQAKPVFEAYQRYNVLINRQGSYFLRMTFPQRAGPSD